MPRDEAFQVERAVITIGDSRGRLGDFGTFGVRLTEPLAISPWEPAISMEAMRLNAGLPVYETAHATHLYGPLLTVVLAAIFGSSA